MKYQNLTENSDNNVVNSNNPNAQNAQFDNADGQFSHYSNPQNLSVKTEQIGSEAKFTENKTPDKQTPQYTQQATQHTQQTPVYSQQQSENQHKPTDNRSNNNSNPIVAIVLAPLRLIWFILKLPLKLYELARYVFFVGCVLPTMFIIGILILIIWQPPLIWEPTKNMINNAYELQDYSEIVSLDNKQTTITDQLATQINSLSSTNSITLTEAELSRLLAMNGTLANQQLDLDQNQLNLLINIDRDSPDPLWLELRFSLEQEAKLESARIGILPLPFNLLAQFIPEDLTAVGERLKLSETNSIGNYFLADAGITTEISSVEIKDEEIIFTAK